MTQPTVFISYSHKDEAEKEQLVSHLGVLAGAGLIDVWVDDRIGAGSDWEHDIAQAMGRAKVAILLITRNFLNSKFILNTEVPTLLERRKSQGLIVFPVIAQSCAWRRVDWLARMNVRPKNGSPVWREGGRYADDELAKIAEEVADIIDRASPVANAGSTSSVPSSSIPQPPPTTAKPQPAETATGKQPQSGGINISDISGDEIEIGHVISGSAGGDVVGEDKVGGDKIEAGGNVAGRDNINQTYSNSEQSEMSKSEDSSGSAKKWWVPIVVAIIGLIGTIFAVIWPGGDGGGPVSGPEVGDFTYQVRVQAQDTGESISNAVVTIEVGGQAPLDGITDSTGLARIFVSDSHAGRPGRLIVEAERYERYRQEIDITEGALPKDVLLEPEP